ncbi:transposase [Rhizobium sp. AB2/73]|uniref:IS66-like element accessory protein TnpA n=1 Tax=Rhizobium sp. AB2/73 TaxID=2795216 RepID=UPI001C5EED17|nr:transposase [Rhizobium sp. AB2/73]UEQ80416.1 transposase [Rhizobium sp. AB2/73]
MCLGIRTGSEQFYPIFKGGPARTDTLEPGASVSEIARSADIHSGQLFRWRRQLCQISAPPTPQFIPVDVVAGLPGPDPVETTPPSRPRKKTSVVTIELGRGRRLRVESDIDTEALGRILDVLERR